MRTLPFVSGAAAGAVFDRLAEDYDRNFTDSLIGRAQRSVVWDVLRKTFHSGDNVLELNCGTGEDALFLAANGVSVFACDASKQMIAKAEERLARQWPSAPIVFCHLPTERIDQLNVAQRFDGVFSNFSGLNCVEDLNAVALSLSRLIKQGDRVLICFSTRICLIEILYYSSLGQISKAVRRCKGRSEAVLGGTPLTIYYPSLRQIRLSFASHFRIRSLQGIGVAVPPSYIEPWARRHPGSLRLLCRLESVFSRLPLFRSTGDHMLICFEKVSL